MGKQGLRNVVTVSFFFSYIFSIYPPCFDSLQGCFLIISLEITKYHT